MDPQFLLFDDEMLGHLQSHMPSTDYGMDPQKTAYLFHFVQDGSSKLDYLLHFVQDGS